MSDEERKEKARAARKAWRLANPEKVRESLERWKKKNPDKVKTHKKAWREANSDKLKEAREQWRESNPEKIAEYNKAWREKNPEKVAELNKVWRDKNPDKVRELSKAWRQANPDKVNESNRAWRKANPEKVKAMKKRDNMRRKARLSRTPDGLMALIERMKWTKEQCFTGGWVVANWVNPALGYFPAAAVCEWLESQGCGVVSVDRTALELRYDDHFDEAGLFETFKLGYQRVRDLSGLVTMLEFMGIEVPAAWATIDTAPDRYEWASPLRNVFGHDLTRIKTPKGAKHKRFPCSLNLAALETWLNENQLMGHLRVTCYSDHNDNVWLRIHVRDEDVWKVRISGSGRFPEGALVAAVDALKGLPLTRWDTSKYDTSDVVDPLLAFDPMKYNGLVFPLSVEGMREGLRRYMANDYITNKAVKDLISDGYVVKREDGLYIPSGKDKNWNRGYMDVIEPFDS